MVALVLARFYLSCVTGHIEELSDCVCVALSSKAHFLFCWKIRFFYIRNKHSKWWVSPSSEHPISVLSRGCAIIYPWVYRRAPRLMSPHYILQVPWDDKDGHGARRCAACKYEKHSNEERGRANRDCNLHCVLAFFRCVVCQRCKHSNRWR